MVSPNIKPFRQLTSIFRSMPISSMLLNVYRYVEVIVIEDVWIVINARCHCQAEIAEISVHSMPSLLCNILLLSIHHHGQKKVVSKGTAEA